MYLARNVSRSADVESVDGVRGPPDGRVEVSDGDLGDVEREAVAGGNVVGAAVVHAAAVPLALVLVVGKDLLKLRMGENDLYTKYSSKSYIPYKLYFVYKLKKGENDLHSLWCIRDV